MTSMFDYDDSVNLAFDAKIAGKNLVTAKHELLTKTGDFLFLAHSERELALRMQMVEEDIERISYRKLSTVSDSKAKLVRAIFDEWTIRHAHCQHCASVANDGGYVDTPHLTMPPAEHPKILGDQKYNTPPADDNDSNQKVPGIPHIAPSGDTPWGESVKPFTNDPFTKDYGQNANHLGILDQ